MKHSKTALMRRLFAIVAIVLLVSPGYGLEQMSNASFTASLTDWTTSTVLGNLTAVRAGLSNTAAFAPITNIGTQTTCSFWGGAQRGNGTPNDNAPAYVYLKQDILDGATLASAANVEVSLYHCGRVEYVNGVSPWSAALSGGIYRNSPDGQIGASVVEHTWDSTSTAGDTTTAWTRVATWTGQLTGGATYSMRLQWRLEAQDKGSNNTYFGYYVDVVSVNMSPYGLTASETRAGAYGTPGAASLTWPASVPVANAPGLSTTVNKYRIYRSLTSGSYGTTPYATTNSTVWSETPAEDVVYYCITDVDSTGRESPKSVETVFKRAKMQITKVEVTQTTVTRGQSGLPVKVYITNTGLSPIAFEGASLTFKLPAVGHYNWTFQSAPPEIPAGGTIVAEFKVDVLGDSICDLDIIDATASGSNMITGQPLQDTGADLTASWLIRAPSHLRVLSVVSSNTVFLGQTGVPVQVTVENYENPDDPGAQNAAGLWDATSLKFDLGTYLNILPQTEMPVVLYSGQATTVTYLLEVSPTSATGTTDIDAWISFRDINLQVPTANNDGALFPSHWTIVAGLVNTYKDPARLIKSDDFNIGYYTIFARAENLTPFKEHRLRWYEPNNPVAVAISDPAVMTDEDGGFDGEFDILPTTKPGLWRVEGTRVFDKIPLCVNYFTIGAPAAATLSFQLPPAVSLSYPFIATLTISNIGSATILDAEPASMTWLPTNTGTATYVAGPNPLRQNIDGETSKQYLYTFQAASVGNFQLSIAGFGFDANASTTPKIIFDIATSNVCIIQRPAQLQLTSLTEIYEDVAAGQEDLVVTATVANTGEAAAYLDAATLSYSIGGHTETVASPPSFAGQILPGGEATTIVFNVDVAETTSGNNNPVSASVRGRDVNSLATISCTGGIASWVVDTIKGKLSKSAFPTPPTNPSTEQYRFTVGSKVYLYFWNFGAGDYRVYVAPAGSAEGTYVTRSTKSDNVTALAWDFLTTGWTAGTYEVRLYTTAGNGDPNLPSVTSLYFELQNASTLVSTFTLSPDPVEVGATITATLFVSNPVSGGSTFSPTEPTAPQIVGGSDGDALYQSGPTPPSAAVTPNFPATFTWLYTATDDTGTSGSFSMVATATGIDLNTAETKTTSDVSNAITIVRRAVLLSSDTIDFGTMKCFTSKTVGNSNVIATGNVDLSNVSWQPAHLIATTGVYIDRSNLGFSPANGFDVIVGTPIPASFSLSIPYNQSTGTYKAALNIWDDFNPPNGAREGGEPFDSFIASVTIAPTQLIVFDEDLIDMGNWPPSSLVATQTFTAFNGGNVTLNSLKFLPPVATLSTLCLTFTPSDLATNGTLIASMSANIAAGASGIYIATYTVFEDDNGNGLADDETSDTIQFLFRIGSVGLTVLDDPLDLGVSTPTYSISNVPFQIRNDGTIAITKLKLFSGDLNRVGGGGTIPGENLYADFPATIDPAGTETAGMNLYVAAGVLSGTYKGSQTVYDDLDNDGVVDTNEPQDSFEITLFVNPYGAIDVINSTVSLGNRVPSEIGTIGFLCRNIGSIPLTNLSWQEKDLTFDAGSRIATDDYFFLAPNTVAPGEIFTASLSFVITPSTDGDYYGKYAYLFSPHSPPTLNATDPQDFFTLYCKIGAKSINIIENMTLASQTVPYQTSSEVSYTLNNDGLLVLARPIATLTTDLDSGSAIIPRAQITLTPTVFAYMNSGQNKTGKWTVTIPANTDPGIYIGELKVWNDENANGIPEDTYEASDTMEIRVEVISKAAIAVIEDPLDLFFVPANQSKTSIFTIRNVGNQPLNGVTIKATPAPLNPIAPGPTPIPAPTFNIVTPALFPDDATGSFTASLTVTVPIGQTGMPYSGVQTVYVDGSGESDTFLVKLTVGEKRFTADTPLDFGLKAPGSTYTLPFTLRNLTSIGISKGTWAPVSLQSAEGAVIATLSTLLAPFTIAANSTKSTSVSLTIPSTQAPGTYIGTHTAFEDDSGDATYTAGEASASVQVRITVDSLPLLQILQTTISAGTLSAGETSTPLEVSIYNSGNATFTSSSFSWATSDLSDGTHTISALTFGNIVPLPLSPGAYATCTITIGPLASNQEPGFYQGNQTLNATAPTAFDTVTLSLTVSPTVTGPNVGSSSVYQELATSTFAAAAPENRFILSAWVCPCSGSAAIGFFRADSDNENAGYDGVIIASTATITPFGSMVDAGILETQSVKSNQPGLPPLLIWHRIYMTFDYTFNPSTASSTYILLQNRSLGNGLATPSVWFDGVQIEKPELPGQIRPTRFAPNKKIITPSAEQSIDGTGYMYEW